MDDLNSLFHIIWNDINGFTNHTVLCSSSSSEAIDIVVSHNRNFVSVVSVTNIFMFNFIENSYICHVK